MILFFGNGRLGNQVFQYAFLRSMARPGETILLFGLEELAEAFEGIRARHLPRWSTVDRVLAWLARVRLISGVVQRRVRKHGESCAVPEYAKTAGVLTAVTYVAEGYFQSEALFAPDALGGLEIRKAHADAAHEFVSRVPGNRHKVFIHVRRGDYSSLEVMGQSASLPLSYFRERIDWFERNRPDCWYVFVSDDPAYVSAQFEMVRCKTVSDFHNPAVDLAIMSMCDSGILSNSSLSWWGAYLMERRDIVFAPRFWLGFARQEWFPDGISPSFATLVDVRPERPS